MIDRPTSEGVKRTALIALALAAILAVGCGSSGSSTTTSSSASTLAPIHGKYSPSIDPADFVATVDNPYWPLKPGTGFHFKGVRGTTPQRDDEIVTDRTKTIEGIASTVVRDTVSERTGPVERTFDYYAQDTAGNVWYMGELSLENGDVLVTSEYSPLEPQTEQKYYVSGVGEVKEKVVKGHHEEFKLVAITH